MNMEKSKRRKRRKHKWKGKNTTDPGTGQVSVDNVKQQKKRKRLNSDVQSTTNEKSAKLHTSVIDSKGQATKTQKKNWTKAKVKHRKENVDAAKKRSKKRKKQKAETATTATKVQTHAALYRNPEEFSSNWKKLMQEIGSKKGLKRKDHSGKSTQLFKKRKKNETTDSDTKLSVEAAVQKPEIWFDDVDEDLLDLDVQKSTPDEGSDKKSEESKVKKESGKETDTNTDSSNPLVKDTTYEGVTKAVAMDCEMVGVGEGGKDSVLARVSLVNHFGKCIYDKYVKPRENVTDFRTQFSGIRAVNLKNAEDFTTVQKDVFNIINGRILVGHALHNDLKVLFLDHPRKKICDTSRYREFRKLFQGKTPSLKNLTQKVLSVKVQKGEHNSVEDAQAAMRLYTTYKKEWEREIKFARVKNKLVKTSDVAPSEKDTSDLLD